MTKIDVTQPYFGGDFVPHKLVTNLALKLGVSLNLNLTDYMNSFMAVKSDCQQINLLFIDTLSSIILVRFISVIIILVREQVLVKNHINHHPHHREHGITE